MVKENIYGQKVFYRIDPSLAEKPKEGGASKKVLHAQRHFPQPISERNTMNR